MIEAADIRLRGLRKTYGSFVAVARVDFSVERGQVVGLLGPNGAGKTTSLRVLMGMTRPTEGEIRQAISGNLCRCTGYVNIVKSVQHAADAMAAGAK